MRPFAALALAAALVLPAVPSRADVQVPDTSVSFAEKVDDLALLGTGLRTKTFLKVKVYAIGLYAAESGLAAHKGKGATPALYKDLVWGDFGKELRLKFVREVTASQIQEAFRESLEKADKAKVDAFVAYFGDTKVGQEYVLRWAPGGVLKTTVNGAAKPDITDKNFAAAVFGIWLGEHPVQDEIKDGLVSRFR